MKDMTHSEEEQQHPGARQVWVERCNSNVSKGKEHNASKATQPLSQYAEMVMYFFKSGLSYG